MTKEPNFEEALFDFMKENEELLRRLAKHEAAERAADERLAQANRDGIEDSWYEENDE